MKNKKSEKGAISILVLVSLVLFSTFLMSTYIIISNKVKTQKEIIEETKKIYEVETEEEAYNSFFAKNDTVIPIYTNEQYLNIATGSTMGINGKYYNFAEDASYILMNNLEIKEDELPEEWMAPEIFFRSNNKGNINYSNHIVKIKYNNNSEEIYNGEKQLPHEYEEVEYIESNGI